MSKDIVKKILFEFKANTGEVNKKVQEMVKQSGMGDPTVRRATLDFAKQFEKHIGNTSGATKQMVDHIRQLNRVELQQMGLKTQDLINKMDRFQQKAKQYATANPALAARYSAQAGRLSSNYIPQAMTQFGAMANAYGGGAGGGSGGFDGGGFGGGFFGSMARGLGIPTTTAAITLAAGAAAAKAVQLYANGPMNRLGTAMGYQGLTDFYTSGAMSGDYSRAYYLMANPNAMAQSQAAAGVGTGGFMEGNIRGGLKDIGRFFRSMPGAFENGWDIFGGWNTKWNLLEKQDTAEALRMKQALDVNATKLLPYIQSRAGARLPYQRAFNASDYDLYEDLRAANKTGVLENEYLGTAMSLRNVVGNVNARAIGTGVGAVRSRTGMDLGTAASMMATLTGMTGVGAGSEEKIISLFAKAMATGINDSALAEMVVKGNLEAAAQAGIRGNPGMALSAATLAASANPNDINTAKFAANINSYLDTANTSSGLSRMMNFQNMRGIAEKIMPNAPASVKEAWAMDATARGSAWAANPMADHPIYGKYYSKDAEMTANLELQKGNKRLLSVLGPYGFVGADASVIKGFQDFNKADVRTQVSQDIVAKNPNLGFLSVKPTVADPRFKGTQADVVGNEAPLASEAAQQEKASGVTLKGLDVAVGMQTKAALSGGGVGITGATDELITSLQRFKDALAATGQVMAK